MNGPSVKTNEISTPDSVSLFVPGLSYERSLQCPFWKLYSERVGIIVFPSFFLVRILYLILLGLLCAKKSFSLSSLARLLLLSFCRKKRERGKRLTDRGGAGGICSSRSEFVGLLRSFVFCLFHSAGVAAAVGGGQKLCS